MLTLVLHPNIQRSIKIAPLYGFPPVYQLPSPISIKGFGVQRNYEETSDVGCFHRLDVIKCILQLSILRCNPLGKKWMKNTMK